MILRSFILGVILTATTIDCQRSRAYDTSDWIPLDQPCDTCYEDGLKSAPIVEQKRAMGRVLNLASPNERAFFPEEIQYQKKNVHPIINGQFHQERVLPPQYLQGPQKQQQFGPPLLQQGQTPGSQFIAQGQPFLPPQSFRNPNVLRGQDGINYFISNFPTQNKTTNNAFDSAGFREINQAVFNNPLPPQTISDYRQIDLTTSNPQHDRKQHEQVQLVYVPLENLRPRGERPRQQQQQSDQVIQRQNLRPFSLPVQPPPPKQIQLQNIQHDFTQQSLQAQQLEQQFLSQPQFVPVLDITTEPITTTTTTASPRRRKPHQPPLAVYMGANGEVKVTDVLNLLKDAKSIAVQDSVGPESPQVFVGPSTLDPPDGYAKFDLPYLSNIDSNRIERKTDQLPFFVAPLSYKTPPGYSKIPFPAPHVGSVVVSQPKELLHEKTQTERAPAIRQPLRESPDYSTPDYLASSTRNQLEPSTTVRYQFVELDQPQGIPSRASPLEDHRFFAPQQVAPSGREQSKYETTPNYLSHTSPFTTSTGSIGNIQHQEEFVPVTQGAAGADKYTVLEEFSINQNQRQKSTTPGTKTRFSQTSPNYLNTAFVDTQTRPISTDAPALQRLNSNTRFFPTGNQPIIQQQEIQYVPVTDPQYEFRPQKELVPLTDEIIEPARLRNPGSTRPPRPQYVQEVAEEDVVPARQRNPDSLRNNPQYITDNGRYNLPSELPAINDQLPGLINSLQDQSLRPLLNPTLIVPTTEEVTEPPVVQIVTSSTTPEPTTTTEPPTTTRRLRSRQRVVTRPQSASTTISPRRVPVHRGRRPYSRTTTTTLQPESNIVSSTTEIYSEVVSGNEEISRTNVIRSRYQSPDSEPPKRTSASPVRSRFRTRGRPATTVDDSIVNDRTSAERSLVNAQPEEVKSTPLFVPSNVDSYMEFNQETGRNGDIIITSKKQPIDISPPPTEYILLEERPTTESVKPTPKVYFQEVRNQPQQQYQDDFNSQKQEQTIVLRPIDESQYVRIVPSNQQRLVEQVAEVTTTKSVPRGRGRPRVTPRPRVISPPVVSNTNSASRTYEKTNTADESEEEFYGFIRTPEFNREAQPPQQAVNKYSSRLSEGNLVSTPNVPINQYTVQSTPKSLSPQQVYVDDKNTNLYVEVYTNDQQSSTAAPADYQLSSRAYSPITERIVTDKQYTIEEGPIDIVQKPRLARPRGRLPSRSSTTEHTPVQNESTTTRRNFRQRKPASNEVSSEETSTSSSRNTRLRGRGKSHFKAPKKETTSDEDVEGGNYPANFLRAVESQSQRPGFKITVEPGYEDSKDSDQLPFSSIYRPRYVPRDPENGEESQWTPGTAATFNDIPFETKPNPNWNVEPEQTYTTTEDAAAAIPASTTDELKSYTEETVTETDAFETTTQPIVMEKRIETDTESVEDVAATTTTPKPKGRRRGVWRLVKKPTVDEFETAESQNLHPASVNSFTETEKTDVETKIHVKKAEAVLDENLQNSADSTDSTTTTEGSLFESLYEMFGLENEGTVSKNFTQPIYEISDSGNYSDSTTLSNKDNVDVTTILPTVQEENETTQNTPDVTTQRPETVATTDDLSNIELEGDNLEQEVAKTFRTSTTTEISHETEICYRGRCIKTATEV